MLAARYHAGAGAETATEPEAAADRSSRGGAAARRGSPPGRKLEEGDVVGLVLVQDAHGMVDAPPAEERFLVLLQDRQFDAAERRRDLEGMLGDGVLRGQHEAAEHHTAPFNALFDDLAPRSRERGPGHQGD